MNIYKAYSSAYNFFCGTHPKQNILHDEWLCLKDIHKDLKESASFINGKTLDVGCGSKPYKLWFLGVNEYVGLDLTNNPLADIQINENQLWPFLDSSFDCVLSFQAFEHIKDIALTQQEIKRILKPNGIICMTIPFISYEHAAPSDYRRASKFGITHFFPEYEVIKVIPQGGFGSTTGTFLLRFIRISMRKTKITRFLWNFLFPFWILFTLFTNIYGWLFDILDRTGNFYHNVLIITKKPK